MKTCTSCGTNLTDHAQFCYHCGKQCKGKGVVCLECGALNPEKAKFCTSCGYPINVKYTPKPNVSPLYQLDFNDIPTLPFQLREAFRVSLSEAVELDGEVDKQHLYLDIFRQSSFQSDVFDQEAIQLTSDFEDWFAQQGAQAFTRIESKLERAFARLIERFLVLYAKELLPVELSPNVLGYEQASLTTVNLHRLILDYLNLEEEGALSYTQAVDIPVKKIKNARKTFFKHQAGETPYIFIDQTFLGSGKEGLILTNRAIYWKMYFHKAAMFEYKELNNLQRFAQHLEVNKIYLNINPSLNYKLIKLLQRIRRLFFAKK